MPKPAKDRALTKLLKENGFFFDTRSYVTMPRKSDATVHLVLEGPDKRAQRVRVFEHHDYYCCVCDCAVSGESDAANAGEWHHPGSCDCVGCTEIRCSPSTGRDCHRHGKSGFRRTAKAVREARTEAAKDFQKLYPEAT